MRDERSLEVDIEQRGGAVVVTPRGEIDLSNSPSLREAMKEALRKSPQRVIVNLEEAPSVDSSGIATLIEAMRMSASSGSRLSLCGVRERVRSVLEIARLDTVFDIREDLDDALEG